MAVHLMSIYGLDYPVKPTEQQKALKEYVHQASIDLTGAEKNQLIALMYEILRRFAVKTGICNLEERMCTLLNQPYTKPETKCVMCGKEAAHKTCSGCHAGRQPAVYCHRDCQKAHWRATHKQECNEKVKPWNPEEITQIVDSLITEHESNEIPVRAVADACSRLFNCVCVCIYAGIVEGRDMPVCIVYSSVKATLPEDHLKFTGDLSLQYKDRVAPNRCLVLSCHFDVYMKNYLTWKSSCA
jgi:hypothetical protein